MKKWLFMICLCCGLTACGSSQSMEDGNDSITIENNSVESSELSEINEDSEETTEFTETKDEQSVDGNKTDSEDSGEDNTENSTEDVQDSVQDEIDDANVKILAAALHEEENKSLLRYYLNALEHVNAGKIQSAVYEEEPNRIVDVVAEDGTNYRIYIVATRKVGAVENMDTGEWPFKIKK